MDYNEALQKLKNGNKRFVSQTAEKKLVTEQDRKNLLAGQAPYAVVICCSDSRVPPEVVFDTSVNELFVIRNAGNVITQVELASLEYALEHLKVPLVVVMGHEKCGAVNAVYNVCKNNNFTYSENFKQIVGEILPSVFDNKDKDNCLPLIEYANARYAKSKILDNAVVKDIMKTTDKLVICARYSIESGEVEFFD